MRKLTRGSLRVLREHVGSAKRPRARWRGIVRVAARERGWNNATAWLYARYAHVSRLHDLACAVSPMMARIQRDAG